MACLKCNKEYQVFTDEFTGEVNVYPVDEAYCLSCEDDKSMSKEEKEKWNNYLDDEMKLAEDNDDYDMLLQRERA